jgi:predicted NBD/HSP70 family sugar kinase
MNSLISEGLLMQVGADESVVGVGRKPQLITVNPKAKFTIGVSIQASQIHIVAVDLKTNIVAKQVRNVVFGNTSEYFTQILMFVYRFIQLSGIEFTNVLGIGIAIPGVVDQETMTIISSRELEIENEHIEKSFKKALFPVWLENDAVASGRYIQEQYSNSGNLLFLSIGQHIKSALFINGEPYEGNNGRGIDIAHVCLVPGGKPCYCGQKGCIEQYLSLANISSDFNTELEDFLTEMAKGKEVYKNAFMEYEKWFSLAITNFYQVYNCNIALGGENIPLLTPFATDFFADAQDISGSGMHLYFDNKPVESSAIGATLHFLKEFIGSV